ncbi:hypothetical protein SK803_00865 [Lentzea sp. BCCO 10_0856]|uniref:NUDIX domain-containing protein n=1 Tax=Lentzea miocenica TaxID=3095431 RepID=A0ABU4SS99_9PSEU|nr:hypothetical protein [Lentzea sp. BCCO 10_0856]MDX8028735.1 hypothetical protein [Lentzea sp. BCCO 10_0856]
MKIYARQAVGSTWKYHETDDEGWDHRTVSLREDWTPVVAAALAEARPSSERDWGQVAWVSVDEWLRRPDVELITAVKFEEVWSLARGALGLPVEVRPYRGNE